MNRRIKEFLEKLVQEFREKLPSIHSIVLFGSLGRGEEKRVGDMDLIFVMDTDLPFTKRIDLLGQIYDDFVEKEENRELLKGYFLNFQPIVYTKAEIVDTPPLLIDVLEDGVILYDDGTMEGKLREIRMKLKRLGARRIWKGKYWFWELWPDIKPGQVFEI